MVSFLLIFCILLSSAFAADFVFATVESKEEFSFSPGLLTPADMNTLWNRGDYLPLFAGTRQIFFQYSSLSQLLKPVPDEWKANHINPNLPMIAITFDDGPGAYTRELLDLFQQYGGKATFFLVGSRLNYYPDSVRQIALDGHELGNHSWSHKYLTSIRQNEMIGEISDTRTKLFEMTGVESTLVRPPYGSVNQSLKDVGKTMGVSFVNWSVDSLDWKLRNPEKICEEVLSHVKDGSIILCHDIHRETVIAMETLIPELQARGFQLVTVSQLIRASGTDPEPGALYYRQPASN